MRRIAGISLLALSSVGFPVLAEGGADDLLLNAVQVTGTSTVRVAPDRVSFRVGVQTAAAEVAAAVEQNNQRTRAVIDALAGAGVERSSIRTSNLSLQPQYEHREGRLPGIVGYHASNEVTVSTDRTEGVGRLIQAAVNAGANQLFQLSYHTSKPGKAREEGLTAAFEDARVKAEALARASGRRLGPALSISEGSVSQPRPPFYARAMMDEAAVSEVPVEAGLTELNAHVSVVFALE